MLVETETTLRTETPYEIYRKKGGKLHPDDCKIALEILNEKEPLVPNSKSTGQLIGIGQHCELEITPHELVIYNALRKIPLKEIELRETLPNTLNACQMSDRKLAREIFLLTDETGAKSFELMVRYSHIFKGV